MAVSASEAATPSVPSPARAGESGSAPALRIAPGTAASPAPAEEPVLSVVLVNFCQWNNTARLTGQLQQSDGARRGRAEVVIVDNHSPPDPRMDRLRRRDGVSLRRFSRNHGFARAVNEGCRLARGEWVLVLNPDMTVGPDFLDRVLEVVSKLGTRSSEPGTETGLTVPRSAFRVPSSIGVVGFRLRHGDGSRQASCGRFPTLWRTLAGLVLPRSRRRCRHYPGGGPREVPWVTGCCLLVRRECLRDLGGFDENFFLYYEDVDFCRRARARGWSVRYEPGVELTHHSPLHTRPVPAALRLITRHALMTYARKHWPVWQWCALGGLVWLEAWARQRWAGWRGRAEAEGHYAGLRALVADVMRGRGRAVRRRLREAARHLEAAAREADSP